MRRCAMHCVILIFVVLCQIENSCAQPKPRSVATGRWISIAATLGPAAAATGLFAFDYIGTDLAGSILIGSAAIFGPGCGHLYAGRVGHFFGGSAIRGGLILTSTISLAAVGAAIIGGSEEVANGAGVVLVSSTALYIGYTIYDIVTVNKSVDRYNEQLKQSNIRLEPRIFSQSRAVGASLSLSFR